MPRWRQALWKTLTAPSRPRTRSSGRPATVTGRTSPGCGIQWVKPAQAPPAAKNSSRSLSNSACPGEAAAGRMLRPTGRPSSGPPQTTGATTGGSAGEAGDGLGDVVVKGTLLAAGRGGDRGVVQFTGPVAQHQRLRPPVGKLPAVRTGGGVRGGAELGAEHRLRQAAGGH